VAPPNNLVQNDAERLKLCKTLKTPKIQYEAVRVAVGMRRGLALCIPHSCPSGDQVDAQGLYAIVCKKGAR